MQERLATEFVSDIPYLACQITKTGRLRSWAETRPDIWSVHTQGLVYLLARRLAEGGYPEDSDRIMGAYRRIASGDHDAAARLIAGCTRDYTQRQIMYVLYRPIEPRYAIQHYAYRRKADWFSAAAYSLTEWEYPGVLEDARALLRDAHHVLDEDNESLSQSHWGQILIRWLKRRERERAANQPVSFAVILQA